MGLLTKLKSLLGLGDERQESPRRDVGVTIEREPEPAEQPDAETERAVKGVDVDEEPDDSDVEPDDATGSAELVEEAESVEEAAEPGEATGPADDAAQPTQTEATEPESGPEELEEAGAEADEREAPDTDTDAAAAEPGVDEEPDAETEAEPGADLTDIKGVGPAYAQRLRDAGVESVADLADADADELAERTDLSAKRISGWIELAQAR